MRRILALCAVATVIGGFAAMARAEGPAAGDADRAAQMKERMAVMQKMREIEKNVISQDEELQKISAQIADLQKQYSELNKQRTQKVQTKLSGNQEYQDLKKKLEAMMPPPPPPKPAGEKPKDAAK